MSQVPSEGQRQPAIVILDFGSQYSELIARRVRETEVFSVVLGYSTTADELRKLAPKGIILSGGPSSVYAEGAPLCDPEIWSLGIPAVSLWCGGWIDCDCPRTTANSADRGLARGGRHPWGW